MRLLLRFLVVGALCALATLIAASPSMGAASCRPVVNPYEGTRYEGVNIRRIQARAVPVVPPVK